MGDEEFKKNVSRYHYAAMQLVHEVLQSGGSVPVPGTGKEYNVNRLKKRAVKCCQKKDCKKMSKKVKKLEKKASKLDPIKLLPKHRLDQLNEWVSEEGGNAITMSQNTDASSSQKSTDTEASQKTPDGDSADETLTAPTDEDIAGSSTAPESKAKKRKINNSNLFDPDIS